jgi:hypothetical protein
MRETSRGTEGEAAAEARARSGFTEEEERTWALIQGAYERLGRGGREPSLPELCRVSRALHLVSEELREQRRAREEGRPPEEEPPPQPGVSAELCRLLRRLRGGPLERLAHSRGMLEALEAARQELASRERMPP